jgi:hypothetical protein
LPVTTDAPPITVQGADWGDVMAEFLTFKMDIDMADILKGLPDNLCQCPHWGYVFKGNVRVRYADHEEMLKAGDAYNMSPGHSPIIEAGTEMIMFSPKGAALDQLNESIEKNMAAMQAGAGAQP